MADIPFQYAEEVDTFRRILKLPEPRESLPRSSTAVMCLDDEKGRQNLDQEVLPPYCLSIQALRMPLKKKKIDQDLQEKYKS